MDVWYSLLCAAATVTQEAPIDGQTGVWVNQNTTVVASGMTISGYVMPLVTVQTMNIYSKGKALDITVSRGIIYVYSGGMVCSMHVPDSPTLTRKTYAYSGANVAAVTLGSRGQLFVSNGGVASGVTLSSGATLLVYSGGTALAVTSHTGATVTVADGGYIAYAQG